MGRRDQALTQPEPENINPKTLARTRKHKSEPGPKPKPNSSPNHARKKTKVKLGLKNLAMLPSYFDYIFVHLGQKAHLRPELNPKFLSNLGPTRKARPSLQLCMGRTNLGHFFNHKEEKQLLLLRSNIVYRLNCLCDSSYCISVELEGIENLE